MKNIIHDLLNVIDNLNAHIDSNMGSKDGRTVVKDEVKELRLISAKKSVQDALIQIKEIVTKG